MSYAGRTHFRTTRGRLLFITILSLTVLIISVVSTIYENDGWVQATCWAIFALSVIAIVDAALSYIVLGDIDFRMRENFRTTVVSRDSIESVSAAKGCPTRLHLDDGKYVDIPELGAQGIENSLRSWIRAT